MNELRTRLIEKAIENKVPIEKTKEYLKLLERTDYNKTMEVKIGTLAELGIKTIGDLVRYGGRKIREDENIGVKTAALISDTLQEHFGIDNWFSKESEF